MERSARKGGTVIESLKKTLLRYSRLELFFIALILVTLLVRLGANAMIESNRVVLHAATQAQVEVEALTEVVRDEEESVRGFQITSRPVFLAFYRATQRLYAMRLAALRRSVAAPAFSDMRVAIDRFEAVHARWTAVAAATGPSTHAASNDARRRYTQATAEQERAAADVSARLQRVLVNLRERTAVTIVSAISLFVVLTVVLGTAAIAGDRWRMREERRLHAELAARADRLSSSVEELEHQRASVLQLVSSKNDLIAALAHDIKGPLTSIVGFAELLEEGFVVGDAAVDAARTIRTNAQRLNTLANDVLALSRVEHGELEVAEDPVDLVALLDDVVEHHRTEHPIDVSSDVSTAIVSGDPERLRQVFENLVRNASKYSPSEAAIDVELRTRGDAFIVSVRDRGMGIPAEELPQLFDRFFRASNARTAKIAGTGIGLFIVKTIVERHGGTVAVESTLNRGSAFTVTLPSIDAPAHGRPSRVTIVTPDIGLSRFVAYELRARGHRVRQYASLDELTGVGDLRPREVVLLDTVPGGAQAVRRLVPQGASVRVVGLSIEREMRDYDATLRKPLLINELLRAVTNGAPMKH